MYFQQFLTAVAFRPWLELIRAAVTRLTELANVRGLHGFAAVFYDETNTCEKWEHNSCRTLASAAFFRVGLSGSLVPRPVTQNLVWGQNWSPLAENKKAQANCKLKRDIDLIVRTICRKTKKFTLSTAIRFVVFVVLWGRCLLVLTYIHIFKPCVMWSQLSHGLFVTALQFKVHSGWRIHSNLLYITNKATSNDRVEK